MSAPITEAFKAIAPKWYTGKALANLLALLPALAESEAQGFWVPGVSRKLTAAMNKLSTATKKIGRQADTIANAMYGDTPSSPQYGTPAYEIHKEVRSSWHRVGHPMFYGSNISTLLPSIKYIEEHGDPDAEQKTILRSAREFVNDLLPVQTLIARLDATRPKPVFTSLGLSPTVTATLTEQLKLNVATVRFPEFRDKWVEQEIKGKLVRFCVTFIIWPKGTVHGQSRFAGGGATSRSHAQHAQCHACGHAIHNIFNWVPFVMDDAAGVPHSFWVGRDCAKNIFNVDVKGECEWENGPAKAEVQS